MDTIFVKRVNESSPAKRAGLKYGDRIVAVNGKAVRDKSYSQVVQLIANSPDFLHLYVIPKEEDIIQRLFSDTAYNPASNQPNIPDYPHDRQTAQKIISQRIQADLNSWRVLQRYHQHPEYGNYSRPTSIVRGQRSADNLDVRAPSSLQQEIYAEIHHPHDLGRQRVRSRAQPQVPLYRKMGRRASEGNPLSDKDQDYSLNGHMFNNQSPMLGINYAAPAMATCRLDVGRRESSSSLASSNADGSKDSLMSYESSSTMTGHETDDSKIMERIRNSFQQKEEFLRAPYSMDAGQMQREYYSRPKRMERSVWPPSERQDSPSRSALKPNHQNFMRVKQDIEHERFQNGGALEEPQQKGAKSPKDKISHNNFEYMQEAAMAPSGYESLELINGSQSANDMYTNDIRVVHKRAKEFESGKPLPEDDPMSHRIEFNRNELARISSKKLVPNVTERAQEYEIRANEPRRDNSGTSTNSGSSVVLRRYQRDARSLDSSGSNASSGSVHEDLLQGRLPASGSSPSGGKPSGNVIISSGSKYIHCPLPSESGKPTDMSANEALRQHARSNSAENWFAELSGDDRKESKRISRQNAQENAMDVPAQPLYADLPPLVREPLERMYLTPSVSITPAPTTAPVPNKPLRPTQLDLEGPVRPARHLKAPATNVDSPVRRSISPVNWDDKPVVVQRRPKPAVVDDESATRRISYLKATEGGRVHFDADLNDGEVSPQQLRSGSLSGNSSNSSLERDKLSDSAPEKDIIREGVLQCKILEIDSKRFKSNWKPVYAVLKGPYLHLYKCKSNQSPVNSSDAVDHNLSQGVDMRTSLVRLSDDKKQNVLSVSSVKPVRSEFFLQPQNLEELGGWMKVLQEQAATTTEAEAKLDHSNSTNQQAVPQQQPAVTTIQVQGHLSPQLGSKKTNSGRNRSPTGQSPVSKSRKPSQIQDPTTSPKSKTWAGRMVKQLRKIQGANSPSSPTAPEVSTFGVPIEHCLPGLNNKFVPRFVEVCTEIVEDKGLQIVGIYRVPGNNASITALTEEINKNFDDLPLNDPKWNDIHVVSSILKSYFRKMPDSLVTLLLYPRFIKADKIDEPRARMEELRKLVRSLPDHNYHTLKHVVEHLNRVVEKSEFNKMETKNLAIVFGPTIVRCESDTMAGMVNDMNNQCKIVETLLTGADYFFSEEKPLLPPLAVPDCSEDLEPNYALLMSNVSKCEALKEKNSAISSIISAAQRKVKRTPKVSSSSQSKEEVTTPTSPKSFSPQHFFNTNDLKTQDKIDGVQRKTDTHEEFTRRVEKFKRDTEEALSRRSKNQNDIGLSSSANNVNQTSRLSLNPSDMLQKTNSASNVYARITNVADSSRNSLNSAQFPVKTISEQYGKIYANKPTIRPQTGDKLESTRSALRRGSSVENINTAAADFNANGGMKKIKYENQEDSNQRSGSLDSLHKQSDGDSDLVRAMTKAYDQIKQKHSNSNLLSGEDLPYADESPDKPQPDNRHADKENIPRPKDLYKNPILHKSQYTAGFKLKEAKYKEQKRDKEKDEDTTSAALPDNERNISNIIKLKRSESLNKPERTVSPLTLKLKRSESLNKGDKLKRSDSLTKNEKTESNNNRRRELSTSGRRSKENTKLKRKNGMPDRSIKRRHTVGGTKDPDKVTWLDNKNQQDSTNVKDNKDKNLRTSSPDLSGSRRERLFLEINVLGGPDMVVALRQHFVGARPQSFPDAVFKMPLESHV